MHQTCNEDDRTSSMLYDSIILRYSEVINANNIVIDLSRVLGIPKVTCTALACLRACARCCHACYC